MKNLFGSLHPPFPPQQTRLWQGDPRLTTLTNDKDVLKSRVEGVSQGILCRGHFGWKSSGVFSVFFNGFALKTLIWRYIMEMFFFEFDLMILRQLRWIYIYIYIYIRDYTRVSIEMGVYHIVSTMGSYIYYKNRVFLWDYYGWSVSLKSEKLFFHGLRCWFHRVKRTEHVASLGRNNHE